MYKLRESERSKDFIEEMNVEKGYLDQEERILSSQD
jgi:hypothetical protein